MDRRQIALKLTVDGLGLPLSVDTFDNRLILQKAIYLAQASGVHLGYHYQWYLYGPYSPSLTRDEYAVAADLAQGLDDSEGWTLDEHSKATLHNLQGLVEEPDRSVLARQLELLASVHFLITRQQVADTNDDQQVVDVLRRFGKDFDERDVQRARGEMGRYRLL